MFHFLVWGTLIPQRCLGLGLTFIILTSVIKSCLKKSHLVFVQTVENSPVSTESKVLGRLLQGPAVCPEINYFYPGRLETALSPAPAPFYFIKKH